MPIEDDHIQIGKGMCPDGSVKDFYADRQVLHDLMDYGPDWKLEDCRFLTEAVENPDAIFEGLAREGHENSLCYSVRPTCDPEEPSDPDESSLVPLPRYGYAFLVFLKVTEGEYLAYDWEWRPEDGDNPGHPSDWEAFGRRLWSRS